MFSEKMNDALNKQVNEEFFSAYLYLSMSSWFDSIGLKGFANWMMVQFKEEMEHAMKFYSYIQSRGGDIKLYAIKEPPSKWDSPLHAFKETLKHEQHITQCINELVDLAEELKDRPSLNFLQWFIDEQVEEEENDRDIIQRLELIGESKNGIFMIDRELAQRVYTPETD